MTTIVRVRQTPGGVDEFGDPIPSSETRTTLAEAFVAPRTTDELTNLGRTGVVIGLTLFTPFGTDIEPDDQVEVDGVLYEVDGQPGDWANPLTGWEAGTTVALTRVEG